MEFDEEEVDERKGTSGRQRPPSLPRRSLESFLFFFPGPDEDGSEFERELTEALEGLSVNPTAEKLSQVVGGTLTL